MPNALSNVSGFEKRGILEQGIIFELCRPQDSYASYGFLTNFGVVKTDTVEPIKIMGLYGWKSNPTPQLHKS